VPSRLAGKVAIITGAGAGIGRAGAIRFAAEGAAVVVADSDIKSGQTVVDEIESAGFGQAKFVQTDVRRRDEVARLVDVTNTAFGKISVLYANAGMHHWGTAEELTPESWDESIAVNLSGQFYLAKYGIPHLEQAGGGSIIFTSSDYGVLAGRRSVSYCATKGALINMTRAIALDCGHKGIRVNCLVPGPTATGHLLRVFDQRPEFEEMQTRAVMLGRLGRPDEIAAAALYLASDDSTFVTGTAHTVDGGVTAWYGV
jgi:NAD(P)-dependent dehydrogenase (short-subunit alcohol dehydrogenase family)